MKKTLVACSFGILSLSFFLLQFLVTKTLDPDSEPDTEPGPDSLEMLDLDQYADPQHCPGVRRNLGGNLKKELPHLFPVHGFLEQDVPC